MSSTTTTMKINMTILCVLLFLGTTFLYIHEEGYFSENQWILDDKMSVLQNPLVIQTQGMGSRRSLLDLWYYDFWGQNALHSYSSHKSWRPLCTLSYRLQYDTLVGNNWFGEDIAGAGNSWPSVGGDVMGTGAKPQDDGRNPQARYLFYWFHVMDRLLHGIVTCLVFLTAGYTTKLLHGSSNNKNGKYNWLWHGGLLVAVIYGVHPIHVESVANTTGRAEVLCAMFYFLGFLGYAKIAAGVSLFHNEGNNNTISKTIVGLLWTLTCTLASLLCKEHGITLPAMCIIWDAYVGTNTSLRKIFHSFSDFSHSDDSHKNSDKKKNKKRTKMKEKDDQKIRNEDNKKHLHFFYRAMLLLSATYIIAMWRLSKNGVTAAPDLACEQNPGACEPQFLTRFVHFSFLWCFNFWIMLYPKRLSADWTGGSIPILKLDGTHTVHDFEELKDKVWDGQLEWWKLASERIPICCIFWLALSVVLYFTIIEAIGDNNVTVNTNDINQNNAENDGEKNKDGSPNITKGGKKMPGSLSKKKKEGEKVPLMVEVLSSSQKQDRSWRRTVLVSFFWMLLPFFLSSNIFVYVGFTVADRTLYLPSFGFCILLVEALVYVFSFITNDWPAWPSSRTSTPKKTNQKSTIFFVPLHFTSAVIIGLYCSKQQYYTKKWATTVDLWSESNRVNPKSYFIERELGLALVNAQRPADAAIKLTHHQKRSENSPWRGRTISDYRAPSVTKRLILPVHKKMKEWKSIASTMEDRFVCATAMANSGNCKDALSMLEDGMYKLDEALKEHLKFANLQREKVERKGGRLEDDEDLMMLFTIHGGLNTKKAALAVTLSKCSQNLEEMAKYAMMAYQSTQNAPVIHHMQSVRNMLDKAQQNNIPPNKVKLVWKKTENEQVAILDFTLN